MSDRSGQYKGNKGLEYYRAYPRDFFEGVVGMPGPLRGFYRMVLDLIYMHDGLLLDDYHHISGHTGFGVTQCRRMLATLVEQGKIHIWAENPEYFTNKRAVSELNTSRKFQENQRNKAVTRWKNNDLAESTALSAELPDDMPPQDHKTTSKKEPAVPKKKPPKRAVSIPQNWVPSDKNIEDAQKQNMTIERIEHEADKFRDHHLAKGSTFKDWDAGWRTWIRNAIKFDKPQVGRGVATGATAAEIADRASRYVERKEAERKAGGDARDIEF